MSYALTKHHGAGNDFLVLLSFDQAPPRDVAGFARRACDRRAGVGADGLIVGRRASGGSGAGGAATGADVRMELYNADGSRAEMSGNGIRCLAQAALDAGVCARPDEVVVHTDAGRRVVSVERRPSPTQLWSRVAMGIVELGGDPPARAAVAVPCKAVLATVGNPHLVVLVDSADELAAVDVAGDGPRIEAGFAAGINVEWIAAGGEPDSLMLRVWERGAGETLACGTGSCASAAAAHEWGLCGRRVTVDNPGGPVVVTLVDTAKTGTWSAELSGPAEFVARVDWVGE